MTGAKVRQFLNTFQVNCHFLLPQELQIDIKEVFKTLCQFKPENFRKYSKLLHENFHKNCKTSCPNFQITVSDRLQLSHMSQWQKKGLCSNIKSCGFVIILHFDTSLLHSKKGRFFKMRLKRFYLGAKNSKYSILIW